MGGARYAMVLPRTVRMGQRGERVSSREGASMEFLDHREYQLGDDPRRVDWNAYARSDKLVVRRYHDEASPHLDVLLDTSASMGLAETQKGLAARALAVCFATAAENAGFTHKVHLMGEQGMELPGSSGRVEGWGEIAFGGAISPEASLLARPARLKTKGTRVLISDLLWPGDPNWLLTRLASESGTTVVVQLLAESDQAAPELGMYRLVDSETGLTRDVTIDQGAQARYLDNLARHTEAWRAGCRRVGAVFVTMTAERVVGAADGTVSRAGEQGSRRGDQREKEPGEGMGLEELVRQEVLQYLS
jgi:uncharacterized protein (DUF58 family)